MILNIKSRKGFTLIELLVVIGILAVLAAIAIPSVAGLIDRANVSADKTNSNEMTNAVERFASEYELYCQDIASGAIKDTDNDGTPDNMDSAQGRVYNVTGAVTRADIEELELTQNETAGDNDVAIYRDTKYPVNAYTIQKVVENYTKTSSSTFEPKQSDMHYWYSPDCGVVVVAEPETEAKDLDKLVVSGKDAKGRDISSNSINAQWIDITDKTNTENTEEIISSIPYGVTYKACISGSTTYTNYLTMTFFEDGSATQVLIYKHKYDDAYSSEQETTVPAGTFTYNNLNVYLNDTIVAYFSNDLNTLYLLDNDGTISEELYKQ